MISDRTAFNDLKRMHLLQDMQGLHIVSFKQKLAFKFEHEQDQNWKNKQQYKNYIQHAIPYIHRQGCIAKKYEIIRFIKFNQLIIQNDISPQYIKWYPINRNLPYFP